MNTLQNINLKNAKAQTSYKLISLTGTTEPITVTADQPTHFAQGLTLHLDVTNGEALIEVLGLSSVFIDGRQIIDVGQVKSGGVIQVGSERYLFLAPLQVFIDTSRATLNRTGLGLGLRSAPGLMEVSHGTMSLTESIIESGLGDDKEWQSSVAMSLIKKQANRRHIRISLLVGVCAALAGFLLMPAVKSRPKASLKPAAVVAKKHPTHAPVPAPVLVQQPTAAPKPAVTTPVPAPAVGSQVNPQTMKTEADATVTAPKKAKIKIQGEGKKAKPDTLISEAALAAEREKYREYVLEAKFDPEGVRSKIDVLLKRVPANTILAKDLRKLRAAL